MPEPGCPRCRAEVAEVDGAWTCPAHGPVAPLHRPREASYDAFARHLADAGRFPTYLPWPLGPGWHVSDFAVVGGGKQPARATMTCCSGTSALDGPVDVFVVTEEPGTGLGARVARLESPDPPDVGEGPSMTRVLVGSTSVPLWAVSTSGADEEFDRYVVVGETAGRWLWLVLRPASAMLLLRDEWILRDVSGIGPPLVEMAFGGPAPGW
jgi:hypothetical protein